MMPLASLDPGKYGQTAFNQIQQTDPFEHFNTKNAG